MVMGLGFAFGRLSPCGLGYCVFRIVTISCTIYTSIRERFILSQSLYPMRDYMYILLYLIMHEIPFQNKGETEIRPTGHKCTVFFCLFYALCRSEVL